MLTCFRIDVLKVWLLSIAPVKPMFLTMELPERTLDLGNILFGLAPNGRPHNRWRVTRERGGTAGQTFSPTRVMAIAADDA